MPRNVKPSPTQKKSDWKGGGFISCNLSETDKANFAEYVWSDGDNLLQVNALVTSGFSVKWKDNPKYGSVICMLIDDREGSRTKGMVLSGFAEDVSTALAVVLYKHLIMLEGTWDNTVERDFEKGGIG